jgi:hypothetical protein
MKPRLNALLLRFSLGPVQSSFPPGFPEILHSAGVAVALVHEADDHPSSAFPRDRRRSGMLVAGDANVGGEGIKFRLGQTRFLLCGETSTVAGLSIFSGFVLDIGLGRRVLGRCQRPALPWNVFGLGER